MPKVVWKGKLGIMLEIPEEQKKALEYFLKNALMSVTRDLRDYMIPREFILERMIMLRFLVDFANSHGLEATTEIAKISLGKHQKELEK